MTALWTTDSLANAMKAGVQGDVPKTISGISIDSRTIQPGEAYFAIRGDVHDGHDFAGASLEKGAACAVVSREFAKSAPPGRYLVVDDVLAALNRAGSAARARTGAKIVAVTGSVGKTSTKEALLTVLSGEGKTHAAVASFNNHWGVPLTLARMPAASRFGIFEIGMNHSGEITPLTRLVRPHVAIITVVEPVHIENFPNEIAIADAKAEIFLGVEPGGTAIINRDNRHYDRLLQRARTAGVHHVVSFGEHEEADVRMVRLALKPDSSCISARVLGEELTYKLGAPGRHLALNSLAVLAAAKLVGADLAMAAMALAEQQAVKGRGLQVALHLPHGEATLIDESYNANPVSMRAALAVLAGAVTGLRGRRITVLGDMLELGPQAAQIHADLLDPVLEAKTDLVFCCGPMMKHLWQRLPADQRGAYAETSAALEGEVLAEVRPGDVIMVKGSFGSRMGRIVDALKTKVHV